MLLENPVNADVRMDRDLVATAREFAEVYLLPNTRRWEEEGGFPDSIWPLLAQAGFLRLCVPVSLGGLDVAAATYCGIVRELCKGDPAIGMNVAALNSLAMGHIVAFGTDAQKQAYLPKAMTGELRLAWALTEPDAGSDAKRIATNGTAIPGEPGFFRLSGQKMFITNGTRADLVVVLGRIEGGDLTAYLVETAQPGFRVLERIQTVGVSASYTGLIEFDHARAWHTPCTFEQATSLLHRGRLGIASMAVGIAEKALEIAVEHARNREQFNRRLADMQSVQNMIADSYVEIEASRLLTEKGAALWDSGQPCAKEAAAAKLYASETSNRVTNRAIQILGGRGMTRHYLAEKLWRDAKLTEIGEGCSEVQRLIIAKSVLR
jgi:alkylation response protein AidB-like acyl-CoA dehydrogenase